MEPGVDVSPSNQTLPVQPTESTSKPPKLPVSVSKPTPYTFDLGNLLVADPNPLTTTTETSLAATARDGAQALINQLLTTCPIHSSTSGVLLTLPPPTTSLPREKPLPAEKSKTKWEMFAAKKGIAAKKRGEHGKLVYDEATGEWVPKWGFKGKNKAGDGDWIVEVDEKKEKDGDGGRGAGRRDRKEAVRRNERRMRANERRGRKEGA
ncbi:MAG: Rhodanese- sulfurtransferase [Caeruleum heppii]|nr:MAG: Rhodanese- sulfurtransferase [Caeruleum heppii]